MTTVTNVRAARVRQNPIAWVPIGRGTKWATPFRVGIHGNRIQVQQLYRDYLNTRPDLLAALPEIRDTALACGIGCPPGLCHGNVLAELADAL